MSSVSIKGIIVGNLVGLVVGLALGAVLVIVLTAPYEVEDFDKAGEIMSSGIGLAIGFALSGILSIAAGYVAARVARKGELVNGTLSSAVYVAYSIFSIAYWPDEPVIGDIMDVAIAPFFGLLGGYLRLRQAHAARP